MIRLYTLLLLAFLNGQSLLAQYDQGEDPLGRPNLPVIGVLKAEVAPGIQPKVAEQISISFTNGLKNVGGAPPPFTVVNKDQLSRAVAMLQKGESASDLKKTSYWDDMVGAQYLLRLDINSFEMAIDPDSIFDEKRKFVRVDKYQIASANLSVRLVDVATSKVLIFNNFDVSGTTRGFEEFKTQTDSARALMQLNKSIRGVANGMFHSQVAGAAKITAIHKESKGKAEEVILNNVPVIFPNREDGLNVYALLKTYTVEGQVFRDAELVGVVNKGKSYQAGTRNFDVRKGEKKIAEHFAAGTPLVCMPGAFPLGPFSVSESRTSLALQEFKNTGAAPGKVQRILQDVLSETAASRPLLLDIVDREIYDLVQKERELQQKTRSDATQAGISFGSNFFLNVELLTFNKRSALKYKTITEEKPIAAKPAESTPQPSTASKTDKTQQNAPNNKNTKVQDAGTGKADKATGAKTSPNVTPVQPTQVEKITKTVPDKFEARADAKLNVSLVSVKTGEVVFANSYSLLGEGSIPYNKDKYDRVRSEEMAFRNLAASASGFVWGDIQKNLTPKFHLLTVLEPGKNGVETVLVSGGQRSGFFDGMSVEVVELVQEDVDGQKFDRDVVIGELKITEVRPETSVCKVKNGGKELQAKLDGKARIYCRRG